MIIWQAWRTRGHSRIIATLTIELQKTEQIMYHKMCLVLTLATLILAACVPLTPTPEPTATPVPTEVPTPTRTPFPTPAEPAPETPFVEIGSVALLQGEHGVSGKAVVAGRQTLIIMSFKYDGKGPKADIRLVKGKNYEEPAAILIELEQRPYEGHYLLLHIPQAAEAGTADAIAVYAPETGEVYAYAEFE